MDLTHLLSAFVARDPAGLIEIQLTWHGAEQAAQAALRFGEDCQGLPGFIHGGALAALADEIMGVACWMGGYIAPGARITSDFLRPVRPGDRCTLRTRIERVEGRK